MFQPARSSLDNNSCEQKQAMLYNLTEESQADWSVGGLEGQAKRHVMILDEAKIRTSEIIFRALNELYGYEMLVLPFSH